MAYALEGKIRTIKGRKLNALREEGFLPAVVYGHGTEAKNIIFAYNPFVKVYNEAGESNLIDLAIDGGASAKVLVKDIQYDPLSGRLIHADLEQINMNEKLTTNIPLEFIGVAPAEKELGGTLVRSLQEIEIECLPVDLVDHITVDISKLATFEDVIVISDLNIPATLKVLDDADTVIATVAAPRSEEELKALEEKPVAEDVSKVEVAKPKKEEGVPEAGEEAPKSGAKPAK